MKMENLKYNSDEKLDTTKFVRVGDLSYFEGPLLSLFEDLNSGHFFVFDWVDRDQKFNRWIIYKVLPEYLLQFLGGKLSHLNLFESRPNEIVYFTDIDSHNKPFFNYDSFKLNTLPDHYVPNSDNFFELGDCNSFEKIKSVIIGSLSKQKSTNEYFKIFNVSNLKSKETKSIYYNRFQSDLKNTIITHVIRSKSFAFEIVHTNYVEYANITIYPSPKNSESIKRKEYANQYN